MPHPFDASADPLAWWSLLCATALFNLLAWSASAAWIGRQRHTGPLRTLIRWQLLLSAGYVLGCGFRSAFPVYDIQRLCIVDSWLSSVVVGRSVATVAELCFAAQWALLLHAAARATGSSGAARIARIIVPLIALAELCSWYSVLTTSNIGHVFEESSWGVAAVLLLIGTLQVWPRLPRAFGPVLATGCVLLLGYAVYMFRVDVPMYWSRWIADVDQGRHFFSIPQGLVDASDRWIVSHRWDDWKSEVVWMSLYFSVGVWLSISLVHAAARSAAGRHGVIESEPTLRRVRDELSMRRDAH